MALIICPECGGKVSDQAEQCIHCGYPLNCNNEQKKLFDVIFKGFVNVSAKYKYQDVVVELIRKMMQLDYVSVKRAVENPPYAVITGVDESNAKLVKEELERCKSLVEIRESQSLIDNNEKLSIFNGTSNVVSCPHCGSTQITTGQRGFSLVTGFIGAGKTVNRCAKCGWRWEP